MAGRNSYDVTVERGIKQRHETACRAGDGKRCTCRIPAFIASATLSGRRRYSPTLRSLNAARSWRRDAITDNLPPRGDHDDDPNALSVRAGWREFVRGAEAGVARTRSGTTYRPRALQDYDSAMRTHALDRIGDAPLERLDAATVQRLIDELAEAGVSPSRQHAVATAIRALTRWASRRGTGQRVSGLELPRVRSRTPEIRDPSAIEQLLELIPDADARLFAALGAYAGARASEIAALDADDVDRDAMVVRLGEHEDGRKTAAARREVPILAVLVPHLDAHPVVDGPLFSAGRSVRARYDRLYRSTRAAWREIDPRPTPHTLRHNWISWLLAAGVPLPAVQRLAGHETPLAPGVTLAIYGHATGDHVAEARQTIDRWIAQQPRRRNQS